MPMPMSISGSPCSRQPALSSPSRSIICSAAWQAQERVLRLLLGRAPEGHDRVADVLVERPPVARHDDVGHRRQVLVQELEEHVRVELLRERGEAADVGEEDRQLALVAAELSAPSFASTCSTMAGERKRPKVSRARRFSRSSEKNR